MPKYRVTSPSGRPFMINAPEGATETEAIEYARNYLADFDETAPRSSLATGRGTLADPFRPDDSLGFGEDDEDEVYGKAPVGAYVLRGGKPVQRDASLWENVVGAGARGIAALKEAPGRIADTGKLESLDEEQAISESRKPVSYLRGEPIYARDVAASRNDRTSEAIEAERAGAIPGIAEREAGRVGRIQDVQRETEQLRPQSVQALDRAEGAWDTVKAIADAPIDTILNIGTESGVQFAPAMLAGLVTKNPGVVAAMSGGTSGAIEFANGMSDYAASQGVDTSSPDAMREFLSDEGNRTEALNYAKTRAGIVGSVDALTGPMGKYLVLPEKALGGVVRREAANIAVQTGTQMAAGAGGEAAAQLATTGEISGKDVVLEAAGELVSTPGEVAGFALDRAAGNEVVQRSEARAAEVEAGTLPRGTAGVEDALDAARAQRGVALDGKARADEIISGRRSKEVGPRAGTVIDEHLAELDRAGGDGRMETAAVRDLLRERDELDSLVREQDDLKKAGVLGTPQTRLTEAERAIADNRRAEIGGTLQKHRSALGSQRLAAQMRERLGKIDNDNDLIGLAEQLRPGFAADLTPTAPIAQQTEQTAPTAAAAATPLQTPSVVPATTAPAAASAPAQPQQDSMESLLEQHRTAVAGANDKNRTPDQRRVAKREAQWLMARIEEANSADPIEQQANAALDEVAAEGAQPEVAQPAAAPPAATQVNLTTNNPGGEFEINAQRKAEARAKTSGLPTAQVMIDGPTTATAADIAMPVADLLKLPNTITEARGPGDPQYDRLLAKVQREGFRNNEPVQVMVNHKGEAYLADGNTRVAVASALGLTDVPVRVEWKNGAEKVAGKLTPAMVSQLARPVPQSTAPTNVEPEMHSASNVRLARSKLSVEAVRAAAAKAKGVPSTVVQSFDDLPEAARERVQAQGAKPNEVPAIMFNGRSYLVADNIRSEDQVAPLVQHETAHVGLRQRYGTELTSRLLELADGLGGLKGVLRLANKQGIDLTDYAEGFASPESAMTEGEQLAAVTEELIASIAETSGKLRAYLEEAIGLFREFVRDFTGGKAFAQRGVTDVRAEAAGARRAARSAEPVADEDVRIAREDEGFSAEEAADLNMALEEMLAQSENEVRLARTPTNVGFNSLQAKVQAPFGAVTKKSAAFATWFDKALLDEFADLRKVQKTLFNSPLGQSLNAQQRENMDAYGRENLRHGAFQDERERAETRFIAPVARVLSKAGVTQAAFSDYLWWRHAPERDAYLRSHATPRVLARAGADGFAGISPADAIKNMAGIDPAQRRAMDRAAKFVDGMRNYTLDELVASGQITPQHRANLLDQYQYFVPFRGMPDGSELLNSGQGGRGLSMNKNAIGPRAAGRKSKPDNILEQMVTDMDRALVGKQKQRVLSALVRMIVANPDPDLWEINPVKSERKWVDGKLTVVQRDGSNNDQITFMHRGIPVRIDIKHDGLRKAILNMDVAAVPALRFIGRITRWLSAIKTMWSPFFLLINPVRDASMASMALMAEHDTATIQSFAKFYIPSVAALRIDQKRKPGTPQSPVMAKAVQYAREFGSAGGKTGYTYVADIREQQKKLSSLMVRHAKSKGMADILAGNFTTKDAGLLTRKAGQHFMHLIAVTNDMAENGTRLAVFSAMREKGMAVSDAAKYAKEVTVNFNRRGAWSQNIGSLYMFFNAAVQGSARLVKLMGNKRFAMTMGGLMGASYALALGQMMAAGDDDDGESFYDKAAGDKANQRSIPIYLGDGKTLNIPVPYGPNMFTYMGYRLAKMQYDLMRDRPAGPVATDILGQVMTSMSPIDPGKGAPALLPEVLRAPFQAATNTNDFGGKISPKLNPFDHTDKANYIESDERTGWLYRMMAAAMNNTTGGSAYDGGFFNLTGEQVRYITEQYTGGPGRLVTDSYELIENMLKGVDPEPSDVPLANVYLKGQSVEKMTQAKYYDNTDDYENTVADWKLAIDRGDEDKLNQLVEDAPWVMGSEADASTAAGREASEGTMAQVKRSTDKTLKELRKAKNAVNADDTLSAREKTEEIKALDQQIEVTQRYFTTQFNAARGYQTESR